MTPTEILDSTPWFCDVSAELKEALASKMVLREVDAGHIFTHEGFPVSNLLIIEGTAARSMVYSIYLFLIALSQFICFICI